MANVAGITHGPDGTPSQESLDSMIAAFEYVPPTALIDAKIKELEKYIQDMIDAQTKGDDSAFQEAKRKFNEKKEEVLKWLNETKESIDKKIHEIIDPILKSIEDQIPDPVKAICDVDLLAPSITPKVSLSVDCLKNMVLAIVYPYKPLIKVVQWWATHFIPKMTSYISQRIGDVTTMISKVQALTPPSVPTQL